MAINPAPANIKTTPNASLQENCHGGNRVGDSSANAGASINATKAVPFKILLTRPGLGAMTSAWNASTFPGPPAMVA